MPAASYDCGTDADKSRQFWGPLFDSQGNLIGINTFISSGVEGIHWAVAVSEIGEFMETVPAPELASPVRIDSMVLGLVEKYFRSISASDQEATRAPGLLEYHAQSCMAVGRKSF